MGPLTTPRSDALFGIFLQDMREIRQKHHRCFLHKYFRFDYAGKEEGGYCLFIEPDISPKAVKREIMQAFDRRLNQDVLPVNEITKKKRKGLNL